MNLHAVVSGVIGAVNPHVPVLVQVSAGYTTTPAGNRVAVYAPPVAMMAQVQALTSTDLRKLDGLNIQGSMRTLYISGSIDGVSRLAQKGGDLVVLPNGTTYLTTMALEGWPNWCKVAVTLQNGA